MTAPPVQYFTTDDGVRIAYSVAGSGPALIFLPIESLSMTGRWQVPAAVSFYERLGAGRTFVTYDRRGMGLSDRTEVADLDRSVADLLCLADHLGFASFDIFSSREFIGLEVASRFSERVRRIVLWEATASPSEMIAGPTMDLARRMVEGDWASYWWGMLGMLDLPGEFAEQWAASISQENYQRLIEQGLEMGDLTDRLGLITAETLVINHDESVVIPVDSSAAVAAGIEGASFVPLRGSPYTPWHQTAADDVLQVVLPFLDDDEPASEAPAPGGFQTVMFTDLEASTALTQRLGDEGAQELLRGHNATVRGALDANAGREVKHTGDGIMAAFPSAVGAVIAALQIQRELARGEVRVRIGNAGEPIAEDDDLFGTAVQLAARVTDRAEPAQILVTRVVADLCAGKTFTFASIGSVSMKGFDDAIELFEVSA